MKTDGGKPGHLLQTLSRGMEAFRLIAESPEGLTIAQVAEKLQVDRAIAYRIVATLEADAFVARASTGKFCLGGAVLAIASGLEQNLRAYVEPSLLILAREARATAYLSVARGTDAVAVVVAEAENGLIRVGYRVGSRHPLDRGAAGIAILAGRTESANDPASVKQARIDGFSVTRGQLQRGAVGVAAPVIFSKSGNYALEASIGVVALDDLDVATTAPRVVKCAQAISSFYAK